MIPPDILAFPGLSEHERRVVELRIRQGLRANVVANRLGVDIKQVYSALRSAHDRFRGKRPRHATCKQGPPPPWIADPGWFGRQVAYVRQIADSPDPTHQQRYLNGIAMCWGQEWADKVEAAASSTRSEA